VAGVPRTLANEYNDRVPSSFVDRRRLHELRASHWDGVYIDNALTPPTDITKGKKPAALERCRDAGSGLQDVEPGLQGGSCTRSLRMANEVMFAKCSSHLEQGYILEWNASSGILRQIRELQPAYDAWVVTPAGQYEALQNGHWRSRSDADGQDRDWKLPRLRSFQAVLRWIPRTAASARSRRGRASLGGF